MVCKGYCGARSHTTPALSGLWDGGAGNQYSPQVFNLFYNPFSTENLLLKLVCRRYRRRSGWSWREQAGLPKAGHSPFAWPHGHSCSAPSRGTWDSLQKPGPRQKRYHLKTSLYPVEPKNDHLLEASTSKLNSGSVTLREQASSHMGELSP